MSATGKRIVVLGLITRMPFAGAVWQALHYVLGLRRLGYDVYYVEAHGITPIHFMQSREDDGAARAAAFLDRLLRRFDLGDRWAYHAVNDGNRHFGISEQRLKQLYRSADLLINLHGGTIPLPEHTATGRLVYLETDPVELEIELHDRSAATVEFAAAHQSFSTYGLNFGNPDCRVPLPEGIDFLPAPPPVLLDLWQNDGAPTNNAFTTVGNWRQHLHVVTFEGEVYTWSKHVEFLKFLELPGRAQETFELALDSYTDDDRELLERNGWKVRPARPLSDDLDAYRRYVCGSRGEFTVAKDQNVRLRSGWFSDRSATYLAAGRPVITQDTGFGSFLPTGEGLFAFSTMDEILAAVEQINIDYGRHSRAALEIAREYLDADRVLPRVLEHFGAGISRTRSKGESAFPRELVLEPASRHPTALPDETVEQVLARPLPTSAGSDEPPAESVVVVTCDGLVFTRLCLESLLASTGPRCEIVVVDNGSRDGTPAYLRRLAGLNPRVRPIFNEENHGFARATNQGLAAARGAVIVLLNNDTVVPPGWLERLSAPLADPEVGLVGPLTNRSGCEAEITVSYESYGELMGFAEAHARATPPTLTDVRTVTMFCAALRRDVYEQVGALDEQFGLGLFEDDDYAMRVRDAGLRVALAESAFVHHFGQGTIGRLVATGHYGALFHGNRRRFEEKWSVSWETHGRRSEPGYVDLVERIRVTVAEAVADDGMMVVVSKGDEALLDLGGRPAVHFPQAEDGTYAGHYPADSGQAIAQLEALRGDGARYVVFPSTSLWWLEHYDGLRGYLEAHGPAAGADETCLIYDLGGR